MKLFRYSPKDAYLLLYTISLFALPFYMAFYTVPSVWWILVGAVHAYLIANLQNTSVHHQTHWSAFSNNKLNSYYEIFLSMPAGAACQTWKRSHLLHHKYVNDQVDETGQTKDPASVYYLGKNQNPTNFWVFICQSGYRDFIKMFRMEKLQHAGKQYHLLDKYNKQYIKEQIAIKLYFLSIFVINVWYGVALLGIYLIGHIANFAISYGEHYGVLDRRGDTTQDSVGSYNWFVNFIGFGAGYHQEHHHKPGTHWTDLHLVTPVLHPDRKIIKGFHIANNPYWSHFKLLFKKS
jgi:fatty acid desaturase